jgi:hypothetical protein
MKLKISVFALLAVLLLVLTPLMAGCLTVPGPEDGKKYPVVTRPTTIPHVAKTTVAKTPVVTPTPAITKTSVPATIAPAIPSGTLAVSSGTCTQIGGTIVTPGYTCTGPWLAASDTFSCCSVTPVAETYGSSNESVTAIPPAFSLSVNLDDDPGSIVP